MLSRIEQMSMSIAIGEPADGRSQRPLASRQAKSGHPTPLRSPPNRPTGRFSRPAHPGSRTGPTDLQTYASAEQKQTDRKPPSRMRRRSLVPYHTTMAASDHPGPFGLRLWRPKRNARRRRIAQHSRSRTPTQRRARGVTSPFRQEPKTSTKRTRQATSDHRR